MFMHKEYPTTGFFAKYYPVGRHSVIYSAAEISQYKTPVNLRDDCFIGK